MAVVACAILAPLPGGVSAASASGPRLSYWSQGGSGIRFITSSPSGGGRRVVLGESGSRPIPLGRAAWSANGGRFAFAGVARGHGESGERIYLANQAGTDIVPVPGTRGAANPVLSPDGRTLAFTRSRGRQRRLPDGGTATVYRSVSIWVIRIDRARAQRITPWRNRLSELPSSFSPDGSILAVTRVRELGEPGVGRVHDSAVALHLDGSRAELLAGNAIEPMYSPDGTRLALVTVEPPRPFSSELPLLFTPTELAVANADGSELTALTHTPRAIEREPGWDPSSDRLVFTRHGLGPIGIGEVGGSLLEINADGSCPTRLLSAGRNSFYAPAWQPGPGRAAGPISC